MAPSLSALGFKLSQRNKGTATEKAAASSSAHSSSTAVNVEPADASSATISAALRDNPFGTAARSISRITGITTEAEDRDCELEELNHYLEILAGLFPDVHVEVFRELLLRFDGDSRLEICADQLLRYRREWVKGRWNVPLAPATTIEHTSEAREGVPDEERFRSKEYKNAVKEAMVLEFRSLSKSTIRAVLAEVNYSYARARPTLQQLSRKTWRATLGNLLPFKKKKPQTDVPPFLIWGNETNDDSAPMLKESGCAELDEELRSTFLCPLLNRRREKQEYDDYNQAIELNEAEAKVAEALYECECCFSEVAFEQISSCSESSHIICFSCIRHTLHEALFGQGWSRSIDISRSTLWCLAPLPKGTCKGILDFDLVKRAVLAERSGFETYLKFEQRLSSESLLKSNLKLISCPFCPYAEVDPVFNPSGSGLVWRLRRRPRHFDVVIGVLLLDLISFLIVPLLVLFLFLPSTASKLFTTSLQNLCLKTRNKRFKCGNQSCRRESCLTCHKAWQDPHICHEPLLESLTRTVEAARTAAVKRTCPRCGLSFVKSSGCNKLTCVCGYSMCYLCRKALGLKDIQNNIAIQQRDINIVDGALEVHVDENGPNEGEGYKHFCEHFRLIPGTRCTECDKCELYLAEDEDAVADRAGERAKREWKIRQGVDIDRLLTSESGGLAFRAAAVTSSQRFNSTWSLSSVWKLITQDLWQDQRWKLEIQVLADKLIESFVVVDEF